METRTERRQVLTAFTVYLRTGRRIALGPVEMKYNPWHDEENGRFTFAGQGRYFGTGASGHGNTEVGLNAAAGGARPQGQQGQPTRAGAIGAPDRSHLRPDYPGNYSVLIVERGDTLSDIAQRRKGLTARDLAWLNQHPIDQPLRVGQRIKVPTQAYLNAGRAAREKFLALSNYINVHDGKLPPDVANPPSLQSQILDSDWRRERKNGYDFHIDIIARMRRTNGYLSMGRAEPRSRRNQREAGKPDRLMDDDGGHFIAARFNGPSDRFNHFAQNASFNRGSYRAMENGWAKALQAGRKVFVDIVPRYAGTSKRPDRIHVTWIIDGQQSVQKFSNAAKGQSRDD